MVGTVFSAAVRAVVVAKPVTLRILRSISLIFLSQSAFLTSLLVSIKSTFLIKLSLHLF